ncbi:NAD(P)/FAD-dependent oxidoreductase [Sphingoaurantiacus capsulatus]|uniref:NAD(P)/FAD-dependent oxidoreductase n=1 Tax=Sphingoaurantiacus capsulatus TaxID=1771310 RepID=A0ABV7X518_9SPHN
MLTEARDLRSGTVPWNEADWLSPDGGPLPSGIVDIAIIGAGIMGCALAERLSAEGNRIALLDRRPPANGSTAASTAEIMWAMDVPLQHLAERIGEEAAARRWVRVHDAVRGFAARIDDLGIDCARIDRSVLYLEGDLLDAKALEAEAVLHQRHGLPSHFLPPAQVAADHGLPPRAAILSEGGYELDPVKLTLGLLDRALARGTTLTWPCDVVSLDTSNEAVSMQLADGRSMTARRVILATGYEAARLFLPPDFSLLSTFAIATRPGTPPPWRGNLMVWEAASPYLYARMSADGRLIAGGADIDATDKRARDRCLPDSAAAIATRLEALLSTTVEIDRKWAATFGSSPDGLPAIGRSALNPNVWVAAGYGGNGIAFAGLAAEMLAKAMAGDDDPAAADFDPYRFG